MNANEQFIEWLSDAYAMERSLVDTLKKHASDAEDFPDIRRPIDDHRAVTERHAEQIEALLEELGADRSGLKTAVARMSGILGGLPTSMAGDVLVKNALMEFSSENFEIACYTSLIAAAQELGLDHVVSTLEGILADEQQMAALLEEAIPQITVRHLLDTQVA